MITISTPNKQFSGVRRGIQFQRGRAEVADLAPEARAAFEAMGYTVAESVEKPKAQRKAASNG